MPKLANGQTKIIGHGPGDFRTSDGKSFASSVKARAHQNRLDGHKPPTATGGQKPNHPPPQTWHEAEQQRVEKLQAKDRAAAVEQIDPTNLAAMQASVAKTKAEREARAVEPKTITDRVAQQRKRKAAEQARHDKLLKARRKLENTDETAATWYGGSTPSEGDPGIDARTHALAVDRQNRARAGNPNKPPATVG